MTIIDVLRELAIANAALASIKQQLAVANARRADDVEKLREYRQVIRKIELVTVCEYAHRVAVEALRG